MRGSHFARALGGLLAIFCSAAGAFAGIGESLEDCDKVFGRHVGPLIPMPPPEKGALQIRVAYDYTWRDFSIRAYFTGRDVADTRCVLLTFFRAKGVLSEAEIGEILTANSAGSSWEAVPGGWIRADRKAVAAGRDLLTIYTSDYHRDVPPDNGRQVWESLRAGAVPKK